MDRRPTKAPPRGFPDRRDGGASKPAYHHVGLDALTRGRPKPHRGRRPARGHAAGEILSKREALADTPDIRGLDDARRAGAASGREGGSGSRSAPPPALLHRQSDLPGLLIATDSADLGENPSASSAPPSPNSVTTARARNRAGLETKGHRATASSVRDREPADPVLGRFFRRGRPTRDPQRDRVATPDPIAGMRYRPGARTAIPDLRALDDDSNDLPSLGENTRSTMSRREADRVGRSPRPVMSPPQRLTS